MTLPALVAAALLATLYGAGFHLVFGGSGRRLLLYLLSGWLGFGLGHFVGNLLDMRLLMLGPVNVLAASIGSAVALASARWLAGSSLNTGGP